MAWWLLFLMQFLSIQPYPTEPNQCRRINFRKVIFWNPWLLILQLKKTTKASFIGTSIIWQRSHHEIASSQYRCGCEGGVSKLERELLHIMSRISRHDGFPFIYGLHGTILMQFIGTHLDGSLSTFIKSSTSLSYHQTLLFCILTSLVRTSDFYIFIIFIF